MSPGGKASIVAAPHGVVLLVRGPMPPCPSGRPCDGNAGSERVTVADQYVLVPRRELRTGPREAGADEGVVPDGHERGRLREVEAQGVVADRRDLGWDHERARKVGVPEGAISDLHERGRLREVGAKEGAVPDQHERGRLRQVQACELGVGEGGGADSPDGRAHFERAREVRVRLQEITWDVCHRRVGELPARLGAARSDGAPLHARQRPPVRGRVLAVGRDLGSVGGEAGAHGCGRPRGGGCEVAAHGEAEQASQTEQRHAVGAHLAFGVLECLVLVGPDVHDDGTNSAVAVSVTRPRDPDHLGMPREPHHLATPPSVQPGSAALGYVLLVTAPSCCVTSCCLGFGNHACTRRWRAEHQSGGCRRRTRRWRACFPSVQYIKNLPGRESRGAAAAAEAARPSAQSAGADALDQARVAAWGTWLEEYFLEPGSRRYAELYGALRILSRRGGGRGGGAGMRGGGRCGNVGVPPRALRARGARLRRLLGAEARGRGAARDPGAGGRGRAAVRCAGGGSRRGRAAAGAARARAGP
eukprot:scaffold12567_cov55-Phaeocystis_antarctica.AAC.8